MLLVHKDITIFFLCISARIDKRIIAEMKGFLTDVKQKKSAMNIISKSL